MFLEILFSDLGGLLTFFRKQMGCGYECYSQAWNESKPIYYLLYPDLGQTNQTLCAQCIWLKGRRVWEKERGKTGREDDDEE